MKEFEIIASISIPDTERKAAIEQAFIANFGDIAEGEAPEHFVERKVEGWILSVYANKTAEQARASIHDSTLTEIQKAAKIKQAPELKKEAKA